MSRRCLLIVSLAAAGCGTEAPAPDKPTWVDDVKPILQANCFHCHGATADPKAKAVRWDVPELATKAPYAEMGFMEVSMAVISAADTNHFTLMKVYTASDFPETERMPPPPATRLSTRDLAVLENWSKTGYTIGTHKPNYKPTARWINKQTGWYEVVDGNGDQVLGQIDCDGTMAQIPRSGAHRLPMGAQAPCQLRLFDGFDDGDVTVNLR